jgi:hypothetical protein
MDTKKLGTVLIILGILGLIAAFLVDIIRTGVLKIQAAQILVIELGLVAIAAGLVFRQLSVEGNPFLKFVKWLANLPLTLWALAGFLITYLVFFISPMFFAFPPRIVYFHRYLPDRYPIGFDLHLLTDLIRQWMETGQTPFHITLYPPLTYILFAPLTLVNDTNLLYRMVTIATVLSFILAGMVIPLLMKKNGNKSLIFVFAATGLISYGMQFELERGQFNVIAFLFGMAAVYIYHHHHAFRRYAYVLFTLSVQLKIYPAILILMLVRDWRDWKDNLRRFLALGAVNFALLFIMGWGAFTEFMRAVTEQVQSPGWSWTGNHSIKAFFSEFVETNGYGIASAATVEFVQKFNSAITNTFLSFFLVCLISILVKAYRENWKHLDSSLLMVCTIGALIIPVSNDYTLPILAGPMALAVISFSNSEYGKGKAAAILLLIALTAAYSTILYPFKYKVLFLQNSFPPLFIALVCATILAHLAKPEDETQASA